MKNPMARFRDAGSFIAGLLIGISIVLAVFATMVAFPSPWQTLWIFGASVMLATGLGLQAVLTTALRHRLQADLQDVVTPGALLEP